MSIVVCAVLLLFSHLSALISLPVSILDLLCDLSAHFPKTYFFLKYINSCLYMPRRKAFPLMPELFSLTSYSTCFLNLRWLSSSNPAEVLFLFQGLVKTSFLQGAVLSVSHLLTPNGINPHIF